MGVYQRGKVWWIDYGYQGKRIREPVGKKEEARVLLGCRLEDIRNGRDPALRRIKPKPFAEMMVEFKERHIRLCRGKDPYGVSIRVLERHFDGRTLQEITPGAVQSFIAARIAEGVSKATVNRARACLSKLFSCAKAWGYYGGENPVAAVKPFRESAGRVRFLTADEAASLIEHAADHVKPVILTMLHTGGRVSEVLGLRWSDISLERGVLCFDQRNTKSGKQREVPIDPELDDMLRQRRKVRHMGNADRDRLVFTWGGKRIERVSKAFATARERAGLGKDVTPHVCRHSFASWFMIKGGDLYRLQRYLGHSTIVLTQRYAHLSPEYLKAGVKYFGAPEAAQKPSAKSARHKSVTSAG